MPVNYDRTVWFYDPLSRFIFGRALINAQLYLLKYISINSSIIIIGGGTGWILEEISALIASGLTITYVETSEKMIDRSKKRFIANNEVVFINQPIETIKSLSPFDVVITPFLFDNFKDETADKIFYHLHKLLKSDGLWLYSDFQPGNCLWQKLLLKSMLLFFTVLCGLEATKLPEMDQIFERYNYKVLDRQTFYRNFVISKIYLNTIQPT